MNALFKKYLLSAALASAVAMPVGATTITLAADGQWNIFDVDSNYSLSGGLEWIDAQSFAGYNNDGSALDFKFTLQSAAVLTVVDGGFAGDQFQVLDNGSVLGYTSVPTNSYPTSVGANFDAALANPSFSSAEFYLSAGQHDITGLLSLSATNNSGSAFDATVGAVSLTAVPVPAALQLFLVGSGLLGVFARRRA